MHQYKTWYVFKISDSTRTEKWITDGKNEKEARRNILKSLLYNTFHCPKIDLLSVHKDYWDARDWRNK